MKKIFFIFFILVNFLSCETDDKSMIANHNQTNSIEIAFVDKDYYKNNQNLNKALKTF